MTNPTMLATVAILAGTVLGCARGPATPRLEYYPQNPVERAHVWPRTIAEECTAEFLRSKVASMVSIDDAVDRFQELEWDCAQNDHGAVCTFEFTYFDAAIRKVYDPTLFQNDVTIHMELLEVDDRIFINDLNFEELTSEVTEQEYRAGMLELRQLGDFLPSSELSVEDYMNNCEPEVPSNEQ